MCRGHFLTACIGLLLSWHYNGLSVATEPGYLDFDNLPETNFSCEGKVIGGYYADTETGCQMFHVCTIGQKGPVAGEITDIKFLCLNGTVFDQETRVCERLDEVDCSKSESFYDLNLELYNNQGAGYGIQPENEESQDENLCEDEDEEECKTEKPRASTKTITEQVQASSAEPEDEETTEQPPITPSTTSRRPAVTSTSFPSTSPAPQILQFPSSSPETIAALLALHKAFTQSLQQHSSNKDNKVNPPKLTGFVESLDPSKTNQQAETFEIKSVPAPPSPRIPSPFSPKTQSQFNIQQSPLKPQYQSPPKPQYQSPPKPQYQSLPKPQYQSPPKPQYQSPPKPQYQSLPKPQYQSPPKPQYQSSLKPQFQTAPKPPQPSPSLTLPPVTYPKPVQATSERYGNTHFHHSFHINTQIDHFPDNYQDQYTDHEPQPSSQPQTEAPKQYDFNDYDEEDYYDEKPQTSTITPYLLHQLKVNQVRNANQAKASSVNHGSFVREVSSPTQAKAFSVPTFRSVTTPGIAIITATSTTSSSSVKTSKPVLSAIPHQKENLSTAGFVSSLLHSSDTNNSTQQYPDPPQSYDDYIEGDVHSDPFYKDVPKIGRKKRSLQEELENSENLVSFNHSSLAKLKDKLLDIVFKNNSDIVLHAIIKQYCNNNKSNATSSLVNLCMSENDIRVGSEYRTILGGKWKIVIPKRDSNYLYLVKSISTSSEYQNSTSNILLLVNFPDEFKLIRDSVLEQLEQEQLSNDIFRNVSLNSVNNLVHHRFKRVRRNRPQLIVKTEVENKSTRKKVPMKRTKNPREKRQTYTRIPDENLDLRNSAQRNSNVRQTYQRTRGREGLRPNVHNQRAQVIPNTREVETEEESEVQRPQRVRQRRPQSRRPSLPAPTTRLQQSHREESPGIPVTIPPHRNSPPPLRQIEPETRPSTEPSAQDKYLGGRPSSKRRGQGKRYHFTENIPTERTFLQRPDEATGDGDVEVSTTYPFNLKPGTQFSCDDKIKGGYYADVESECFGYFICSQGEINGPLLKSHFWCGPTTKFNQRSRTCQIEANVACSVSQRYYHLNKDILSLPDPEDDVKDSFEPAKV